MISRLEISLVLEARLPRELAEFYSHVMDAEIRQGVSSNHWCLLAPNGIKIQIYRPSTSKPPSIKGKAMAPCVAAKASSNPLEALSEWSLALEEKGAKVIDAPRLEAFGAESWLSDPEGNSFLLVVPIL